MHVCVCEWVCEWLNEHDVRSVVVCVDGISANARTSEACRATAVWQLVDVVIQTEAETEAETDALHM